ncbi:MAG: hypothetical protein KGK03_00635 [Candidatus Omnitrophica bacterium]|nr:hypothetical protein [Candidatus Omnitrophota bacterium]
MKTQESIAQRHQGQRHPKGLAAFKIDACKQAQAQDRRKIRRMHDDP